MGHGYRPLRVLYAAAVFILIGWAVFCYGAAQGVMLPTKLQGNPAVMPDTYQTLSPLVYSLDTFLPIIDFHQAATGSLAPAPRLAVELGFTCGPTLAWAGSLLLSP